MASSSTFNHKARAEDTVSSIAAQMGVKPEDIVALNPGLQLNSAMTPGQNYKIPATVAIPSATALSDLQKEIEARQTEAGKSKTKGKNGNP